MKHFVVKAMIFKILRERGRTVGTEIETRNGIADVIDVDNLIVYEVETKITKKRVEEKTRQFKNFRDLFVFNANKFSNDLNLLEKKLQDLIV